ncbi:glutamate racemase [Solibacillus kalamii]|uniref:Asp/Glu racemase n=1 Tax=Solibacillus kalamii TaxID=1748298 RepID=A0ABX3ZK76_9BACL|nr:hypothetical protein [Solibacillus kalamii]MBM7664070.1 glutamate racemase [Solibacillus kalamii]OUZ40154.1 hypothetical protein CBM15_06465 [Solibacillus kalamii]
MRKRLGCLHAHYSNIEYIENVLAPFNIELVHFVDPGLMNRLTSDQKFNEVDAQQKVKEQLEWIAQTNVDAILITCTNYIAILKDDQLSIPVPIIKLDEPFFDFICNIQQPHTLLFTNPATVEGTMERLRLFADTYQKSLNIEVVVLNNMFDLIMQGRKKEYDQEVARMLEQLIYDDKIISVAQLSMVDAAQLVEAKTGRSITNPLKTFVSSIVKELDLEEKIN